MRRAAGVAAVAALIAVNLVGSGTARASIVTPYAQTGTQAVIDGVVHEWGTTQAEYIDAVTGPETTTQSINVIRVSADAPDVQFETGLPLGRVNARERTTLQAARLSEPGHRVVASINGDFWRLKDGVRSPINLNVRNADLASAQPGERGAIGFKADGTPIIGRPTIAMSLTMPDSTVVPLAGVNQIRDADEVILYTPTFGAATATTSAGVEVVLSGVPSPLPVSGTFTGTVESVHVGVKNSVIPTGAVVLSATGANSAALGTLVADALVPITLSIDEPWQDVVNAVGGLRVLVHEGVAATDFSTPPEVYRNARSAAGITADGGVILVTVDGLESGSTGLVQADLAQVMLSLGAVEAINLDGGGSATMVVDPYGDEPAAIVNVPADGYERWVNTTLHLVSTAPDPDPPVSVVPTVTAPIVRLLPGTTSGKDDAAVDISWQQSDADGEIAATELEKLNSDGTWSPVDLPSPTSTSIGRRLKFKKDFQYRVRVTDDAGNVSDWAVGRIYRINVVNERAAAIVRTGKWPVVGSSSAIGEQFGRSSAKNLNAGSAALSYSAVQVAWVGPAGATGGTADVQLDGTSVGTVSLTRNTTKARLLLFVAPALDETTFVTAPSRTIRLTNVSTAKRPYVDLDAFLLLTVK